MTTHQDHATHAAISMLAGSYIVAMHDFDMAFLALEQGDDPATYYAQRDAYSDAYKACEAALRESMGMTARTQEQGGC